MKRTLVTVAAATFALTCLPTQAQEFVPTKPIRFVAASNPGIPSDIMLRNIAGKLTERTKWATIVENRPGGNYVIATHAVTLAPADGQSILLAASAWTILPATMKDMPFDMRRDLFPLHRFATIPVMLAMSPTLPARTLPELLAYSKSNPGKLSIGGLATGTIGHLSVEMLKIATGLDATYVPYQVGSTLDLDLMAGRVDVGHNTVPNYVEPIKQGRVQPLFVFSARRHPALPNVPTAIEVTGNQGFELDSWFGFFARTGTSKNITDRLETELRGATQSPDIREGMQKIGYVPIDESSVEFRKKVDSELERWVRVAKEAKIQPQ